MNSIDILEILPERTKYGFRIEKEIIKDKIFVVYKTQGRYVKSILPRRIILNEDFFIGLGLSVGDGLNNPSIKNTHYNFANSNFYLVKIVSKWLGEFFNVQPSKLHFFIHSKRNNNIKNSIINVTKLFNLDSNNINVYFTERHSKDVLTIQMSNPIFQLI